MVSLFNNLKYTMPAFKFPESEVVYLHARVRICFPGKAFEAIGIVFWLHFWPIRSDYTQLFVIMFDYTHATTTRAVTPKL